MDERKILLEQVVTYDRGEARAVARRERARGLLELGRPHVVGGRVDQVARQKDALGDASQVFAVHIRGQLEPGHGLVRLSVAGEAISAERERESCKSWIGKPCLGR